MTTATHCCNEPVIGDESCYDSTMAPLVVKETRITFIYALGNILYNGECYAANCKHRVSMWDEHPWCTPCILEKRVTNYVRRTMLRVQSNE